MRLAVGSIEKPLLTWLLILGLLGGGLWGFATIGRLEDPAFTLKQAVVVTAYSGASAEEVAREVSEPLESAIQKMGEIDTIVSVNRPGVSLIEVEVKPTYDGSELPGIWTKLRARVGDAAQNLPDGTSTPLVNDTFGDVYGLFYAVTAPGFSDAELHQAAAFLRREILTVGGVSDVEVAGLPDEAIFVEPDLAIATNQNIPPLALIAAIAAANNVVPAGSVREGSIETRIQAPEGSDTVSAISGLSVGVAGEVVNLSDLAEVDRGRREEPELLVRHDGTEAFTLGVAGISTENIVDVGARVDAKLAELEDALPYGIDLSPIYQQHVVVDEASTGFLVNLVLSVAIVIAVLAVFMGWRAAVVVGATLLLTVVGTLFFMAIFAIEMERISLGALIIAMGMLVDNAIVVAEGMQVGMSRGQGSREAADETARKTQVPLLGATVIGIMAFAGIGLSPDDTGEFLFSLFAVIGISLLLSWVLALTVAPLFGHYFFRRGTAGEGGAYEGPVFRGYASLLRGALRLRWLVVVVLVGVTAACIVGFAQIRQQFFPDSNMPLFLVHHQLQQGSSIQATSEDLAVLEAWLLERDEVEAVTTFAGQGATRFMLTYAAEKPNPSYGHMIVRTQTREQIPAVQEALEAFAAEAFPETETRVNRLVFGPGGSAPIEVRFSGNDPEVLRALGEEAAERLEAASGNVLAVRTNWREPELTIRPVYAAERAQSAGVDREDVANALQLATDGVVAGVYREDDRLIPIIVRIPEEDGLSLLDQVVWSESGSRFLPIEQVIEGLEPEVENTLVHRRNRVPTLTVQADIPPERTAAEVFGEVRGTIEAMGLPPGYAFAWGGEHEASTEAQESLARQLPLSLLVMVTISILLFNALRQPLIIWLLVPMSVNGVTVALLATGLPFTFTALLGLLSLSGMLIKNGIVLVEEIDLVRAEGAQLREAIVRASVSRLRPVVLASATTILGMTPLLWDAFFVSMAVTIMGGLAFASVLTLVAAPVLYLIFFRGAERQEGHRHEPTPKAPAQDILVLTSRARGDARCRPGNEASAQ